MICQHCTKEIENTSLFCKWCGGKIEQPIEKKPITKETIYNILLIVLLLAALFLRISYVNVEQPLWWDAANYLLKAKQFAGETDLEFIYPPQRGYLTSAMWAPFYLFNLNESGIIYFQVFLSLASVYLMYLIGKTLFTRPVGLLAALLSAVFWQNLFFSVRPLAEIPGLTFWLLTIYLFILAYFKNKEKIWYVVFPMVLLTFFIKLQAGILFILIGSMFLLSYKKLKIKWIISSIIIMLIIMIPYFVFSLNEYGTPLGFTGAAVEHQDFNTSYIDSFLGYLFFFPSGLGLFLFLLFSIAFIGIVIESCFGFDQIFINNKLKKYIFLLLWLVSSIILLSVTNFFLPRFSIYFFPAVFIMIALLLVKVFDKVKKYNKLVGIIVIGILLAPGIVYQVSTADSAIKGRATSFQEIKDAGLWLKENTNENDIIITASIHQIMIYSDRQTYTFPELERNFPSLLSKQNPKYLVLSRVEPHPDWVYAFATASDDWQGIKAFPTPDQPTVIIYERVISREILPTA